MRKLLAGVLVCLAAALSGCGTAETVRPEDVVVGNTIPDFNLESLDGATMSKASLKGEPVVLNFFASWCTNCRAEIPELKQVAASAGRKAKVIGIALDETGIDTVKPFVE